MLYFDRIITHRIYQNGLIFGIKKPLANYVIYFSGPSSSKPFSALSTNSISGIDFLEKTQSLPLYRYTAKGECINNITDWGLSQFITYYNDGEITKDAIFQYVYAVLHNPAYRKKYELNLKRDFPRVPFYKDFRKWANWGKELMELHIQYENANPFPLQQQISIVKAEAKRQKELFVNAAEPESMFARQPKVRVKLNADKDTGIIELDELTSLTVVPKEAWNYKLGNRSALEWVLDQYKEKRCKDPTIEEKFNTYKFADYKDKVIDLLKRVCTVSIETSRIIDEMKQAPI